MTTQKDLSQGLSSETPFVAELARIRAQQDHLESVRAKFKDLRSHVEDIRFALMEITGAEDCEESMPPEARAILAQVNSLAAAMAAAAMRIN